MTAAHTTKREAAAAARSIALGYLSQLAKDLTPGYASDLAGAFVDDEGNLCEQDADSLFRTLVLDHDLDVPRARRAYHAAMLVLEVHR
jgi:hypothetical protein